MGPAALGRGPFCERQGEESAVPVLGLGVGRASPGARILTNDKPAAPYWQSMMAMSGVNGHARYVP